MIIFDLLIDQPLQRPRSLDKYAHPADWPELVKLGDFHALLSTCKDMHAWGKFFFEQHQLPRITFYFDNLWQLRDFHSGVVAHKPAYLDIIRFSLRNRPKSIRITVYQDEDTERFIKRHASIASQFPEKLQIFGKQLKDRPETFYDEMTGSLSCLDWSVVRQEPSAEKILFGTCRDVHRALRGVRPAYGAHMEALVRSMVESGDNEGEQE